MASVLTENRKSRIRPGGLKTENPRYRRAGVVLIMVAAILALLALLGTIYIIMASADRQGVYASDKTMNMNFAQQSVLNILRGQMLWQTLDQNGNGHVLAIDPTSSSTPIARLWDYPEMGPLPTSWDTAQSSPTFYQVDATPAPQSQYAPSQPWLVSDLPWEPDTKYAAGDEVVYTKAAVPPAMYTLVCQKTHLSGVPGSDPTTTGNWQTVSPIPASEPLLSFVTPYLYDPSTGQYDINLAWNFDGTASGSTGGSYTVDVPNASVVWPRWSWNDSVSPPSPAALGTPDAIWNLLPYSGPDGTRYRFAMRIVDLSGRLNLNSGYPGNSTTPDPSAPADPYGEYLSSAPIWLQDVSSPDPATTFQSLQTSTAPYGRGGTYGTYNLADWQTQLFHYELPIDPTQFFGFASEMELLTYGSYGSAFDGAAPFYCRPAQILPNTLGFNSGYRDFFTAYSWDRNYFPEPAASATKNFKALAAPATYPYVLNLNQPATAAADIATLFANIVRVLEDCGFNSQHAVAYALNYVAYRFDNASDATSTTAYGPPSLDASGNLYLPWLGTSSVPTGLTNADTGGYQFIGFAAQPFLNELAIAVALPRHGPRSISNDAVELFNPFGTALDLTGWALEIVHPTSGAVIVPPITLPSGTAVAADGYLVVAENGSAGFTPPPRGTVITEAALQFPSAGNFEIVLLRPATAGVATNLPVDTFDGSAFNTGGPPAGPGTYSIQRANEPLGPAGPDIWWCADAANSGVQPGDTLGAVNDENALVTPSPVAIPFYDRFSDPTGTGFYSATPASGAPLVNFDDVNNIARLADMIAPSGALESLPYQIESAAANSYVTTAQHNGQPVFTNEQSQADAYFDFAYDPRAAFTCVNTTTGPVQPSFLSMVSLNDRASDPTVNPGGLPNPIDAVRIPGKINLNTANANVLLTAFSNVPYYSYYGSTFGTNQLAQQQQMAADVIAFRNRDAAAGTVYVPTGSGTATPVTTPAYPTTGGPPAYPGYGLRSLGDMLVALIPSLESSGNTVTTLQERDAAWADVANFLTVRSDTFAVYGLVQALKLNGGYTGAYSPTDWYNANQGNAIGASPTEYTISTDPGNANAEFILEGQHRFVAIIDRSLSNPANPSVSGAPVPQPQIVAVKDLPQ